MSERAVLFDRVVRALSLVLVIGLFVVDYILDMPAKPIPIWAYAIPGLLALGVEMSSLRRLVIAAVQAWARIPHDPSGGKDGK